MKNQSEMMMGNERGGGEFSWLQGKSEQKGYGFFTKKSEMK